jgi:DNA-binding NarL/FixJ family response regulator
VRSSWRVSAAHPLPGETVALACSEGDWPHPDWPPSDGPFRAEFVPPPYDGLRCGLHDTPDVVVLRCEDATEAFGRLLDAMGEKPAPVIVLSPVWDAAQVLGLLQRGAVGYLVDADYCMCMLNAAVAGAPSGQLYLSPLAFAALRERIQYMFDGSSGLVERVRSRLSPRERQIMELLSCGFAAAEIGQRLSLSEKTVRNNLSNIYAKLGARGSVDAVLRWLGAVPGDQAWCGDVR